MKAILFDLDGVIIDSENFFYSTMEALIEECYGVRKKISEELIFRITGATDPEVYKGIISYFGLSVGWEELMRTTMAYYERHYGGFEEAVPLLEGADDFVRRAKAAGLKLAVCTSSNRAYATKILKRFSLYPLFDLLVCGDEITHSKPDPEIYLRGAKKLGISAKECLVIEDSYNGIAAGKSAEMYVLAAKVSRISQNTSEADREFYTYAELDPLILKEL